MKVETNKTKGRKKDDRHNQVYFQSAYANCRVDLSDADIQCDKLLGSKRLYEKFFGTSIPFHAETPDDLVAKVARRIIRNKGIQFSNEDIEIEVLPKYMYSRDKDKKDIELTLRLNWRVHKEKPSLLPSAEEVLDRVDIESVGDKFEVIVKEAIELINEKNEQIAILDDTETLSRWIGDQAMFRSKDDTEYQDRLDELKKEFEEKLRSLKREVVDTAYKEGQSIVDDWENVLERSETENFHPESTKNAVKYWQRFIDQPDGGFNSSSLLSQKARRTTAMSRIKPEDFDFE